MTRKRYFRGRFEDVEIEIISVSKRKLFVIVRLRYNRFEFCVECKISKV